jgi:hypothetical protein
MSQTIWNYTIKDLIFRRNMTLPASPPLKMGVSYSTEGSIIFIFTTVRTSYRIQRFYVSNEFYLKLNLLRAMIPVVSRRVPNAAARVRSKVRSCGIYCGESGTEIGFISLPRLPLPFLILSTAPYSWIVISSALHGLDIDRASLNKLKFCLSFDIIVMKLPFYAYIL